MKIKVIEKAVKGGKKNLYLEYYLGYSIDGDGKKKLHRKFEKLEDLFIYSDPKNSYEKTTNKQNLEIAEKIKNIKIADNVKGKFEFADNKKKETTFLTYFRKKQEERFASKGNYDNWDAAYKHLEKYCSPALTFEKVDLDFISGFKNYLESKATTKSGTLLSQNSKYTYYNKFKACLREAFHDGLMDANLGSKVKAFAQEDTSREYLTFEEVKSLFNTDCKYPVLKDAFLFSCLSGLRWSDINKLVWAEVRDEGDQSKINYRQEKTASVEYLYISKDARKFLGERKGANERVFKGLKYSSTHNTELLRWVMKAGITKHITFHSGRHTHAVMLLEYGADIYTVSKILGHKMLSTTQIYAKVVDKKKIEATTLIPKLTF